LCCPMEAQYAEETDRLLREVEISPRRRAKARAALLRERLISTYVGGCWLLRSSPGASFWRQTRQQGMHRDLAVLMGAHALEYFLLLVSWWLIGRAALQGRLDYGWLLAWALLLLTLVP